MLIPGGVYTFEDPGDEKGFQVSQVICRYSGQEKLAVTGDKAGPSRNSFSLQPLGIWRTVRPLGGEYPPTLLVVHFEFDPCDRPLSQLFGEHDLGSVRISLGHWSVCVSDTEGCVDLSAPKSAENCQVEDEDCPVLVLFEHLKASRWDAELPSLPPAMARSGGPSRCHAEQWPDRVL